MYAKLFDSVSRDLEAMSLPDISVEEFDRLDGSHEFSEAYQEKKQRILAECNGETGYARRRMVKAAAIVAACCLMVPLSAFAAVKLYRIQVEKKQYLANVQITKNDAEETASTEASTGPDAEIKERFYRVEATYLPQGCHPMEGYPGQYGGEDGDESPVSFYMGNIVWDGQSDFMEDVPESTGYEQFEGDGYVAAAFELSETFVQNKVVYVAYENGALLHIYVGYGIDMDETKKIIAGLVVTETDSTDEYCLLNDEWHGYQDFYNTEETTEGTVEAETASTSGNMRYHKVGDVIECRIDGMEKGLSYCVEEVKVYDSIAGFDRSHFIRSDIDGYVDADGNMVPYNRTEVLFGDGVSEGTTFGETKTVKRRFVCLTVLVKNHTKNVIEEYFAQDQLMFTDREVANQGELTYHKYVKDATPGKWCNYYAPLYLDFADGESEEFYRLGDIPAGGEQTYHVGFLVDEDKLDEAYLWVEHGDYTGIHSFVKLMSE